MASTKTLQNTLDFATGFVFGKPLAVGASLEPAITIANTIKQTILAAPFSWRFNSKNVSFNCVIGTQDYPKACSDFGWIDKVSVQDTTGSKWYEMKPMLALGLDSALARPQNIAPQEDDNAGNITFRLMPVPDKVYPVTLTYQKKAPLFTALADTWAPIPDEMAYVYNWGFLSLAFLYSDDQRFAVANSKFVSGLLSNAEGLDETEVNIFLNSWAGLTNAANANLLGAGSQGRGV